MVYGRVFNHATLLGPNAHNQSGPRAIAACVKLCGLDNPLATHRRLAILFDSPNACFLKSGPFRGPQNFSFLATGYTPLVCGI